MPYYLSDEVGEDIQTYLNYGNCGVFGHFVVTLLSLCPSYALVFNLVPYPTIVYIFIWSLLWLCLLLVLSVSTMIWYNQSWVGCWLCNMKPYCLSDEVRKDVHTYSNHECSFSYQIRKLWCVWLLCPSYRLVFNLVIRIS